MYKTQPLQNILSIDDFSKEMILHILTKSKEIKNSQHSLFPHKGKVLASCFFEPSTRTRLSFESAMHRLGGSVIGFSESHHTSVAKGESLQDTIKTISSLADVIVIRHPKEGAAQLAADISEVPVINAGDGANQHPTQTFLDLFTISETQGSLEDRHIAFMGDLKYGRAVHSLAKALCYFKPRLYFISPPSLEMPKQITDTLKEKGIKFSFHQTLQECIEKLDVIYLTRIQIERMITPFEGKMITLDPKILDLAKPSLSILHPLPRQSELPLSVDQHKSAKYFDQAKNGLFVRQALLTMLLEKIK